MTRPWSSLRGEGVAKHHAGSGVDGKRFPHPTAESTQPLDRRDLPGFSKGKDALSCLYSSISVLFGMEGPIKWN